MIEKAITKTLPQDLDHPLRVTISLNTYKRTDSGK